jgi:PleD family two-component response regulator
LEQLIPDPPAPTVAVVMLVDVADDHIGPLAIKRGAQDYLTKSRLEPYDLSSTLRIYARLLQTQAQKFAASETMRTACSTEGCHRYRSKGILERAEFINVPARPG